MTTTSNPDRAPFATRHRDDLARWMRAWLEQYDSVSMHEQIGAQPEHVVTTRYMGDKRQKMRETEREMLGHLIALHSALEHERTSLFAHRVAESLFGERDRYASAGETPEMVARLMLLAGEFECMAFDATPPQRVKTRYIIARSAFWCLLRGADARRARSWALQASLFFADAGYSDWHVAMVQLSLVANRVLDGMSIEQAERFDHIHGTVICQVCGQKPPRNAMSDQCVDCHEAARQPREEWVPCDNYSNCRLPHKQSDTEPFVHLHNAYAPPPTRPTQSDHSQRDLDTHGYTRDNKCGYCGTPMGVVPAHQPGCPNAQS